MRREIPRDTDFAVLVGKELVAFTVGSHHIELAFPDARLVIEAGFEVHGVDIGAMAFPRNLLAQGAGLLPRFLERTITSARWVDRGGLRLEFSGNLEFVACVDDTGFECFSLILPNASSDIVV